MSKVLICTVASLACCAIVVIAAYANSFYILLSENLEKDNCSS